MLSNYKQDSINAINKWLNDATRFKDNTLNVLNYEHFIYEFQTTITYKIKASHITMNYPGGSSIGYECSSYADYCYQIKQTEMAEENNRNNLDYLYNMVQNNDFGFMRKATKLKTSASYRYTTRCNSCSNGMVRCFSCGGSRRFSCNFCAGLGNLNKTRQATGFDGSSYTETYMERCVHCSGRGYNECSSCSGRGEVTCSHCGGSSVRSEVATISVYAIPYYDVIYESDDIDECVSSALGKTLLYDLKEYGEVEFVESSLDSSVYEVYNSRVPFAKITTEFNGDEITFIVYGNNLQISDAGGILDTLLNDDVDRIYNKSKFCILKPFIAFSSKKDIINFMQNNIFKSLFQKDAEYGNVNLQSAQNGYVDSRKQLKFNEIDLLDRAKRDFTLLNNAICKENVIMALQGMYRLTKAICFYSQIKWLLVACVLMFCIHTYNVSHKYLLKINGSYKGKIYTYKKNDVTYLNESYLNALESKKGKSIESVNLDSILANFTFGIFIVNTWNMLGFYSIIVFIGSAWVAYFYRKLWFRLKASPLHLWTSKYEINKSRYFLFLFIGCAILGLIFYFFPIFITNDNLIYGLIPLRYL